jgi:hypothetical protein
MTSKIKIGVKINMETETEKVKVVFRMWKGEVIALFPEIPSDRMGYFCESYMHVGQHSGADYTGIIRLSRPATPAEYANLAKELTSIGYELIALN